jgi:hypothetical protein
MRKKYRDQETIRLVASLLTSCNNVVILSSCYNVVTHNLLTNCWIDKLLEQHCYKSAAGLLQLVRFYVCILCDHRCDSALWKVYGLTHSSYQQRSTGLSFWDIYSHDTRNLQRLTVRFCDCRRELEELRWLENNTVTWEPFNILIPPQSHMRRVFTVLTLPNHCRFCIPSARVSSSSNTGPIEIVWLNL